MYLYLNNSVFIFKFPLFTKNVFENCPLRKTLQIKSKIPSNFLPHLSEAHKKERIFIRHLLWNYFCNAADFTWLPIIKMSQSRKSRSSCT